MERERERERQRHKRREKQAPCREPNARLGLARCWDSRIMPWDKGWCQTAEPPRDPQDQLS